jgi:hypothetical protein
VVLEFSDLSREANRRIANAKESAEEAQMEDSFVACMRFISVRQQTNAGKATLEDCWIALRAAERALTGARARAALSIIDAVVLEYLNVATNHEDLIDQLHRNVVPAINEILPEPSISQVVNARIRYWESQAPAGPSDRVLRRVRRGRLDIPVANKIAALELKLSGKTYADCAQTLYGTARPTPVQRRSVPSVLKHFQSSPQCPPYLRQLQLSTK